jgi:hypothetical protein
VNPATLLRQMRIMDFFFIATIVLYAYAGELFAGKNGSVVTAAMLFGMISCAGFDALIAYYFRSSKLFPALEKLRQNPNDSGALKAWHFSTLVSMVLAESIGLFGFALRFLGASLKVSWSFYAVALALLLFWRPKLELPVGAAGGIGNQ